MSHVLGSLRLAEVVRYDTEGRQARYRLKHPRETQELLKALAISSIRHRRFSDICGLAQLSKHAGSEQEGVTQAGCNTPDRNSKQ